MLSQSRHFISSLTIISRCIKARIPLYPKCTFLSSLPLEEWFGVVGVIIRNSRLYEVGPESWPAFLLLLLYFPPFILGKEMWPELGVLRGNQTWLGFFFFFWTIEALFLCKGEVNTDAVKCCNGPHSLTEESTSTAVFGVAFRMPFLCLDFFSSNLTI